MDNIIKQNKHITIKAIMLILGLMMLLITIKSALSLKTDKTYDFDCLCRDENATPQINYGAYFTFFSPNKSITVNNTIGTNNSNTFLGLWNYSYSFPQTGIWSIYCNCSREQDTIVTHLYEVNVQQYPISISIESPTRPGTTKYDYIYFWTRVSQSSAIVVEVNETNHTMNTIFGPNDINYIYNNTLLSNGNYTYKFYATDNDSRTFTSDSAWIVLNNQTTTTTTTYQAPSGGGGYIQPIEQEETFTDCNLNVNETNLIIQSHKSKTIMADNLQQWNVFLEAQLYSQNSTTNGCSQVVINYTNNMQGLTSQEISIKNNGEMTTNSGCNIKFIVDDDCIDDTIINIIMPYEEQQKTMSILGFSFNINRKFSVLDSEYSFIFIFILIAIISAIIIFSTRLAIYYKMIFFIVLTTVLTVICWYMLNKYAG